MTIVCLVTWILVKTYLSLRQFAPNKVNIADIKLFGVERYLRQIYWNNGSSVDDPYRRCLRLYLNVSHTEGYIDQYPVRLNVLYVFILRLQDLLQWYYNVLKQLNCQLGHISFFFFRMNCSTLTLTVWLEMPCRYRQHLRLSDNRKFPNNAKIDDFKSFNGHERAVSN